MRSFEHSKHNSDLDMVDPEGLSREGAEISWDSLKDVPFNDGSPSLADNKKALNAVVNDLLEISGSESAQKELSARKQEEFAKALQEMEDVSSFGRKAREASPKASSSGVRPGASLSDISKTF